VRPRGLSQARREGALEGAQARLLGGELSEERGDRVGGHVGGTGRVGQEQGKVYTFCHGPVPFDALGGSPATIATPDSPASGASSALCPATPAFCVLSVLCAAGLTS